MVQVFNNSQTLSDIRSEMMRKLIGVGALGVLFFTQHAFADPKEIRCEEPGASDGVYFRMILDTDDYSQSRPQYEFTHIAPPLASGEDRPADFGFNVTRVGNYQVTSTTLLFSYQWLFGQGAQLLSNGLGPSALIRYIEINRSTLKGISRNDDTVLGQLNCDVRDYEPNNRI